MIAYVLRKTVALICGIVSGIGAWKLSDTVGGYYGENTPFYRNARRFGKIQEMVRKNKRELAELKKKQAQRAQVNS